jgi:ABC-type multidrug transport system ATPase subunit
MSIVELHNISKSFGNVQALLNLTLEDHAGELYGFIGPDGAGKTTLFRILTTLLIPDEGNCSVLDLDVVNDYKQIRTKLGYMPGRFSLYEDLTVEENMQFFASVFNTTIEENYDLVKPIYSHLEPFKDRFARNLSGGMKQKLALSCALIHKPELLLLDEPTTGVDAVSRKEFWEMLAMLKDEGITIVVSTPYMDEAEKCDRVALIDKGKILRVDTPAKVISAFEKTLYGIKHPSKYALITTMREYPYSESVQPFGEFVHYTDKRDTFSVDEILDFLHSKNLTDAEVHPISANIEDVFMQLMEAESNE